MDFTAKITSKGQVTLPAGLRNVLSLAPGDRVVFSVATEGPGALVLEDSAEMEKGARRPGMATMSKAPDLIALAGSVPVPARWRDADWSSTRREAWTRHSREREVRSRSSQE